jgi:phosphate-selective porin OprO/OprP
LRGKTEAEFFQSPTFVDTDFFPAEKTFTYNLETYWRKGPFFLGFEYTGVNVDASDYGNPRFYGYFISGSWIITGEMKKYIKRNGLFGPVPVSESVDQGGWGAWEVAIRYSTLDRRQ